MSRQKPTHPDTPDWTLTPQQDTAVDLLASGQTITDTAKAIDVTRQTVSGWVNTHCSFQATLNSRRQELWHASTERLRGLLPKALDVVKRELDGETPLPAAVHVLKACGMYGAVPAPQGPTEVEDAVVEQRQRDWHRTLASMQGV